MRVLIIVLVVVAGLLQYRLWFGEGGLREVWDLRQSLEEQKRQNAALRERNKALEAEVEDLKRGDEAIEERARSELGMIKEDETFYQVVDQPAPTPTSSPGSGE